MDQLSRLIAELHGKIVGPRHDEQLREQIVPAYLVDEYNRASVAAELNRHHSSNLAYGAISYAAITDDAVSVRLRCAELVANSMWPGKLATLLCCIFDSHADIRLLALEAIAINYSNVALEIAPSLVNDTDEYVSNLANMLLRRESDWPRHRY
jgi:hypothetical protein